MVKSKQPIRDKCLLFFKLMGFSYLDRMKQIKRSNPISTKGSQEKWTRTIMKKGQETEKEGK